MMMGTLGDTVDQRVHLKGRRGARRGSRNQSRVRGEMEEDVLTPSGTGDTNPWSATRVSDFGGGTRPGTDRRPRTRPGSLTGVPFRPRSRGRTTKRRDTSLHWVEDAPITLSPSASQ